MKGLESIERAITPEEIAIIIWLLQHGDSGSEKFVPQVKNLQVVSRCTCGCPTVYFGLENNPASRKGEHIISDHLGTVDGQDVGVMLFELDGQLSSLEVYSQAGSDQPFGLPKVESLYSFEDARNRTDLSTGQE